ncbi:MAG: hypothetical protein AAGA54_10435 [Myxococcota bacterium]
MLRLVAVVVVEALVGNAAVPPVPLTPRMVAAAPTIDPVDALHRTGEALFDAGDNAGARVAWTEAYERVEPSEETWPYRATLLSLLVNATLAEFSAGGDRSTVREIAELIDHALEADLDEESRASLEAERARLEPYLDPVPPPVLVDTEEAPADPDAAEAGPERRLSNTAWIAGGGSILAAGTAVVVVGALFEPRASAQVRDAGDSTTVPPGSTFIAQEQRKGTAWIATGSVIAAVGMSALVFGIVRLARDRKRD